MNTRFRMNVFALALAAGACLAATAAPRTLAIDADALEVQSAPERKSEIDATLQAWKLAWELGEVEVYFGIYEADFRGDAPSRAQWEQQRRARVGHGKVGLKMENLRIRVLSDSEAEVQFVQHYSSAGHRDVGEKRLRLRRSGGAWRITEERWTART